MAHYSAPQLTVSAASSVDYWRRRNYKNTVLFKKDARKTSL